MRIYHTAPGWLPADAPYEIEIVIGDRPGCAEQATIVLKAGPEDEYGRKPAAPGTQRQKLNGMDEGYAQVLLIHPLALLLAIDRLKGCEWAVDFDLQKWERDRAEEKAVKRNRNR